MAGRGIGSVEVEVNADTSGFRREVVNAARIAGKQAQKAIDDELGDIGGQKLDRALARIRQKINRELSNILIDIGIDEGAINDDLKRLKAKLKAIELELRIDPDLDEEGIADDIARIRYMLTTIGEVEIKSEVDRENLAEALNEIKKMVDSFDVDAELGLDDEEFKAALIRAQQQLDSLVAEPELDPTKFQEGIAKMRASLRDFEVDLEVDTADARAELQRFKSLLRDLHIDVELDDDQAKASIALLRASMRDLKINAEVEHGDLVKIRESLMAAVDNIEAGVSVDVQAGQIAATVAEINARLKAADIKAPVETEVDKKSLMKTKAMLAASFDKGGSLAGKAFGGGFETGLLTRTGAIIAGIMTLMEPAAVLLEGLAGSLTSVLSSAIFAVGGAAGAATPLVIGLGAALGGILLASEGMGKALTAVAQQDLEAFGKAIETMTPAGKEFAFAVADIWGQVEHMRDSLQGDLFAGLAEPFKDMVNNVLPQLTVGLGAILDQVNEFGIGLMDVIRQADIQGMLTGLAPAIGTLLDGVLSLAGAFVPFIEAATPAARELADMFKEWADNVADFDSAKVAEFLDRGLDSLSQWLDLFGQIQELAGKVFAAGVESGDSFVERLTTALEKFNDFLDTAEGNKALETFFENGTRVIDALLPLIEGLAIGIHNMVGEDSIARFEELAATIGEILPIAGEFFNIMGETGTLQLLADVLLLVAQTLEPMLPTIQSFADAIAGVMDSGVAALGPIMESFAAALELILPALEPLLPLIMGLVAVNASPLTATLFALATVLADMAPLVVELLDAIAPLVDVLKGTLKDALASARPLIEALVKGFTKLAPVIAPLIEVLGELVGTVLEALAPVIDQVVDSLVLLLPPFMKLVEAITPIIPLIAELLVGALQVLTPLLSSLLEAIGPVVTILLDALAPVIPIIVEALVMLADALGPVIDQIGDRLALTLTELAPLLPPIADLFMTLVQAIIPLLPLIADLVTLNNEMMLPALSLIIPMIADIIGIFTELVEELGKVVAFIAKWVGVVIDWFQKLADDLVGHSIIPDMINAIFEWFNKLLDLIGIVVDVFKGIYDTVSNWLGQAKALVETLLGAIQATFDRVWGAVKTATQTAWNLIKGYIVDPITAAWGLVDGILSDISSGISGVWDTIKAATSTAWDAIKLAITNPIDAAKGLIDSSVSAIKSLLSFAGLLGTVQGVFNSIKTAMVSPIQAAKDAISGIVGSIKNSISSIPSPGGLASKLTGGLIGGAAGGLFTQPTPRLIGEAGREALIPLDRPINQIDPAVRGMAEVIRGIKPGGGVTNYWNITETSNAEETAHKVLNRMLVNAA